MLCDIKGCKFWTSKGEKKGNLNHCERKKAREENKRSTCDSGGKWFRLKISKQPKEIAIENPVYSSKMLYHSCPGVSVILTGASKRKDCIQLLLFNRIWGIVIELFK